MPSASKILDGVSLSSLLDDHYYAEARALALSRLETSATSGRIELEGPPINDESDIVPDSYTHLTLPQICSV